MITQRSVIATTAALAAGILVGAMGVQSAVAQGAAPKLTEEQAHAIGVDRYLINSPMLPNLKKNTDGSLTLYIQKDSPGTDKESNWLPAPNGEIYLVMRLYWPRTTAPSILPPGEGAWQPPAIVAAR